MTDPFRNYDAWLERPFQQAQAAGERQADAMEAFDNSEVAADDFALWLADLDPTDLPEALGLTLRNHWAETPHYVRCFAAWMAEMSEPPEPDLEPDYDAEPPADWEP